MAQRKIPLLVYFDGTALRPGDAFAQEQMATLPRGAMLHVEPKLATGSGQRRLYWAGLGLLAQNLESERWPTSRHLSNMLLTKLGYVDIIYRADGGYMLVPDSLAMDSMEEADFLEYFERARAETVAMFDFDPWDAWTAEKDAEAANNSRYTRRR